MKKPFSITDLALNVIRVCLVLGILVALVDFYNRSRETPDIIITGLPTSSASSTAEPLPEDNAPAETVSEPAASMAETEAPAPETTASEASAAPAESASAATAAQTTIAETSAAEQPTAHIVVKEYGDADPEGVSALVNINTAPVNVLMNLTGIGEVKAAAIVEFRRKNGDFGSIDDLKKVKGIGEKTFEKIKNQITV